MKIAKIASEMVSLANELDGAGYASAADSLDHVLQKIAVPGRQEEEWDNPAVTKAPISTNAKQPVPKKPATPNNYSSARISQKDVAGMSIKELFSAIDFYDRMIASAEKTGDRAYLNILRQNVSELSAELSRKRSRLESDRRRNQSQKQYTSTSDGETDDMMDAPEPETPERAEKAKKVIDNLGGKERIETSFQDIRNLVSGLFPPEDIAEVNQMITAIRRKVDNQLADFEENDLEQVGSILSFAEDLKSNPAQIAKLKQLISAKGITALELALKHSMEKGVVPAIEDLYSQFEWDELRPLE